MLKMLLNRKVLCVNNIKPSPLHRAVRDLDLPTIDRLLGNPSIDINKNVYYWDTALHLAVRNNSIPLILKLLDHGAKINELSFAEGYTPLHIAVINKNLTIAELLLTRGADVNRVSNSYYDKFWTPLHFAIFQNNYPLIELLFRFNADINGIHIDNREFNPDDSYVKFHMREPNYFYKTPLHVTVENRRLKTVKYLLNLDDIDINAIESNFARKFGSLLYEPVKDDAKEMTRLLLDGGIDINAINQEKLTVLECVNQSLKQSWRQNNTNSCVDILKKHLVKLDIIGHHLIEQNLNAINDGESDSFRKECLQEIELLKKTRIDKTNITYSGALFKSENVLAVYVRNIDEDATNYDDLVKKLPIYGGIIYFKLKRALKRCRLLQEAEKIIFEIFRLLPYTFVRDIFLHLSNEDLKVLIA